MVEFACKQCGCLVETYSFRIEKHGKKYCSEACQRLAYMKRSTCKCVVCGNEFEVKIYRTNMAKFCSNDCRLSVFKARPVGMDHPDWKGGRVASSQRRRALVKSLPFTFTEDDWHDALANSGGACIYCGDEHKKLEQDHFIPVVRGGGYVRGNIVPACRNCNARKSFKHPKELEREHQPA